MKKFMRFLCLFLLAVVAENSILPLSNNYRKLLKGNGKALGLVSTTLDKAAAHTASTLYNAPVLKEKVRTQEVCLGARALLPASSLDATYPNAISLKSSAKEILLRRLLSTSISPGTPRQDDLLRIVSLLSASMSRAIVDSMGLLLARTVDYPTMHLHYDPFEASFGISAQGLRRVVTDASEARVKDDQEYNDNLYAYTMIMIELIIQNLPPNSIRRVSPYSKFSSAASPKDFGQLLQAFWPGGQFLVRPPMRYTGLRRLKKSTTWNPFSEFTFFLSHESKDEASRLAAVGKHLAKDGDAFAVECPAGYLCIAANDLKRLVYAFDQTLPNPFAIGVDGKTFKMDICKTLETWSFYYHYIGRSFSQSAEKFLPCNLAEFIKDSKSLDDAFTSMQRIVAGIKKAALRNDSLASEKLFKVLFMRFLQNHVIGDPTEYSSSSPFGLMLHEWHERIDELYAQLRGHEKAAQQESQ